MKHVPTLPSIASLWAMERYAHLSRAVCVFGPSSRWFHGVPWFCVVVASVIHLGKNHHISKILLPLD